VARVLLLILLLAGTAHAQIVNVQGQLAKAPAEDGVTGQIEAKLDWREGNNPLFQIGGGGAVLVREGKLLGLVLVKGEYGESRGLTLSRKAFAHVRGRYTIDCRWKWELFGQTEYDRFRRLTLRALVGTGPALQIVDTKTVGVLAGAAYLFELEKLDDREGTIDAGDRTTAHRASVYVTGVEKIGSQVAILETFYAQPRLDDPEDIRLLAELSVTTKLSKHIALTDGLSVAYDRTPPDQIRRVDTQLTVGLLVTF
jgi:hypothetical protein